jgi:ADP-ribose pyrophosphatase YjhB (NUDIX family)
MTANATWPFALWRRALWCIIRQQISLAWRRFSPNKPAMQPPKVDVRGAVFDESGRVLLVREISDSDRWTLPGGWADVNQSPSEGVIREVREEAGVAVTVRKLAAVYDRALHGHMPPHPFHVYKLFFICDVVGGAPQPGSETSEVAFFAENAIPEDLSVARILPHQISRLFEHARRSDLPTDFD